jgi:hypothetical protein
MPPWVLNGRLGVELLLGSVLFDGVAVDVIVPVAMVKRWKGCQIDSQAEERKKM